MSSSRLCVLHGKFSSYLPWHQPFIHALLRGLDEHARNVVVCNRSENEERFPRPELIRWKTRALVQPATAAICAGWLREHVAPDVLHGHFGWSAGRLLLLRHLLGRPLVVTFGGRDAGVQMDDPAMGPLYEIVLASSDRILCVSEHLRGQVVARGADPERVEVVHRGTDVERFARIDRGDRAAGGPLRIAMVGRLVEKKGHDDALAALAAMRARGHDARLDVVGEGRERARLLDLAREHGVADAVTWHAPTDQEGLREHLAAADVFLHSSRTAKDGDVEGIPNVVVEAAATGLPVVGTRHGGIVEVVVDDETGLLVEERDPEGLAAALERLLDREVRLGLGARAAARIRSEFDLRRQVERHLEVYESLRGAPRPTEPLPVDLPERARRAFESRRMPFDWTVARAAAELCGLGDLERTLASSPRGVLDRALEAPSQWPRPWRSAAELGLDLAGRVLPLAGFKERTRARAREFDDRLVEHWRRGEGWPSGAVDLARPLRDLAGEDPAADSRWRRFRARLAGG